MRRLILSLIGATAIVLGAASLASGATTARCGVLYKPACTGPVLVAPPLGVACHKVGTRLTLPKITVRSVAGIREITITVHSSTGTIKTYHFRGRGPTKKVISGVTINTSGLSTGLHSITIVVKDVRGKTRSRTLRFTICPPPKFTG